MKKIILMATLILVAVSGSGLQQLWYCSMASKNMEETNGVVYES
jgi:hypothetical protein